MWRVLFDLQLCTRVQGKVYQVKVRNPIQWRSYLLVIAAMWALHSSTVEGAGGRGWHAVLTPHAAAALHDLTCPTSSTCYVLAGNSGALSSHDRGHSWRTVTPPWKAGRYDTFNAIACPTPLSCIIAAVRGVGVKSKGPSPMPQFPLLTTHDGGHTWKSSRLPTKEEIVALTCPAASMCYGISGGTLLRTGDEGRTWSSLTSAALTGRMNDGPDPPLACPTVAVCFTGSKSGQGPVIVTHDGGRSWSKTRMAPDLGPGAAISGLTCPTITVCYANQMIVTGELRQLAISSGVSGRPILVTYDGGRTVQHQDSSVALGPIACVTAHSCISVAGKSILSLARDRRTWLVQYRGRTDLTGATCLKDGRCFAPGVRGVILTNR